MSPAASLIFADSSVAWRVYSIVCAAEKWAADGEENSHGTALHWPAYSHVEYSEMVILKKT